MAVLRPDAEPALTGRSPAGPGAVASVSGMWRIVGALVVLFVVLSILGLVLRALRWLLGVAVVIAIVAAVLGSIGRSRR